jgi:membrane protein YqaA with SNARE-associated domain
MVSTMVPEILGGLLIGTAVSGVVPLINAELLVVGAVVAAPHIGIPAISLVSATGQMLTKTGLFLAARWAPHRLPRGARVALERAAAAVAARGAAISSLVFTSALTGLPPFFGVSLAAGALGVRARSFVASGGIGRIVRFAVIGWAAREMGGDAIELMASLGPTAQGTGG